MVDSIASTVLEKLTSAAIDKVEETVKLVVGAKEDVQKLTSNFKAIRDVLKDADQRQLKEASIRGWIAKLKDVAYDTDDVLDEWITEIQKAEGKKGENETHDPSDIKNEGISKVLRFLSSPCCFQWKEVVQRHDVALKIKELNQRLDLIASERAKYHLKRLKGSEKPDRPKTTSSVDVSEMKGRDEDKKKVIGMLVDASSGEMSNPRIVSIVGMGGLGKSTLAQLVYNDTLTKTHFTKRIWVFVSDSFDETRVARAILEALTTLPSELRASELQELEAISQRIQNKIQGKRFLLVLDDVWNQDSEKWKPIKNCLMGSLPGSAILVTTRKEKVARIMGCTESDILPLGKLSPEDSWSLFIQLAFFGWSNGERQRVNWEDTGRKLADKCDGLPLAVKILGNYLCSYKSKDKWLSVLRSEVWGLEVAKSNLLPSLWFSYYDLSPELKQCFSYCAIFPKGHTIEKNKLIEAWMAQGYLKDEKGEDMEMVGEDYFQDLAGRSFFQNFEMDEFGEAIVACKMHDLVHDLARFIANNECCHMKDDGSSEVPKIETSSTQPRHSILTLADESLLPLYIDRSTKLRTLIVELENQIEPTQTVVFTRLTSLRSLKLRNCLIANIPSSISSLVHLRDIDLSFNRNLEELPEEFCELYNLEALDISYCWGLKKLPQGIGRLVNLKCLHNVRCYSSLPKGLMRLTSLKRLDMFNIVQNEAGTASLRDLRDMNNLRGDLLIQGLENVVEIGEAKDAQLSAKKKLTGLGLKLGFSDFCFEEGFFEALELSPSMVSLTIYLYSGTSVSTNWMMSLTNLRKLFLCISSCVQLPPLGKLPSLEIAQFSDLYCIKKIGAEFLGIEEEEEKSAISYQGFVSFPKLIKISFDCLSKWEEWEDGLLSGKIKIMPCLRSLSISSCRGLKDLPPYIVQNLTLKKVQTLFCPLVEKKYLPDGVWLKNIAIS